MIGPGGFMQAPRGAETDDCTTCEGHGEVNIRATAYDQDQPTRRCPDCRGTGKQKDVDHDNN